MGVAGVAHGLRLVCSESVSPTNCCKLAMDSSDDEIAANSQPAAEPRKLKRLQRRRLSEEHSLAVNKPAEASADLLNTSSIPTHESSERPNKEATPKPVPEQQSSPAQKRNDPAADGKQPLKSPVFSGTPAH